MRLMISCLFFIAFLSVIGSSGISCGDDKLYENSLGDLKGKSSYIVDIRWILVQNLLDDDPSNDNLMEKQRYETAIKKAEKKCERDVLWSIPPPSDESLGDGYKCEEEYCWDGCDRNILCNGNSFDRPMKVDCNSYSNSNGFRTEIKCTCTLKNVKSSCKVTCNSCPDWLPDVALCGEKECELTDANVNIFEFYKSPYSESINIWKKIKSLFFTWPL